MSIDVAGEEKMKQLKKEYDAKARRKHNSLLMRLFRANHTIIEDYAVITTTGKIIWTRHCAICKIRAPLIIWKPNDKEIMRAKLWKQEEK